jgi:hypothetical protein
MTLDTLEFSLVSMRFYTRIIVVVAVHGLVEEQESSDTFKMIDISCQSSHRGTYCPSNNTEIDRLKSDLYARALAPYLNSGLISL